MACPAGHHGRSDWYRGTPCWSTTTAGPVGDEVICHGDFGPWNTVWRGAQPIGIIDWEPR
ncbi:phosphotransferase [Streptomyces collinus]|uniref:phosphotransferase n=1 Tax=Streptomyces collinus TaxID=42684 RepID=UPI0036BC45B6